MRLAAELAFGADFAGHAGDFGGEGVELVHHGVDGVLELENLALDIDGDLAGEVAAGHGGGDFGDVADLGGEVAGHGVDRVGEVLPGAGHAGHVGLAAEPAFGADFAGHARDFGGERAKLLDHGVERFLELQDFAAHVDGDLAGEVAVGDGGGDFGDVADLAGEVAGHEVDVVGEVLPGAGHAGHLGLAAELAVGADFAGHARDFARRSALSWSTMVLMVFFSSRISPFTSTVILRERSPRATAVVTSAMLRTWAVRLPAMELTESVRSFQVPATPGTLAWPPSRPSVPTSRATRVTSPAKRLSWSTMVLMVSFSSRISPLTFDGDLLGQVAVGDGGGDFGDVADLAGEVEAMELTVSVRSFHVPATPGTCGLAAELAVGAHFAGHAGDFAGEGVELVHHRVDGVFQLQDFALHVDGDLAGEVAAGHGGGHFGDVADLGGQVAGHEVDVVGEVLPGAGDAGHLRLAAELAFGAHFAGHAGDFGGEGVELVHHGVDGVLQLENFALHVDGDLAGEVAAGHGGGDFGDVADLGGEVAGHGVDGVGEVLPGAGHAGHVGLAAEPAFGADFAGHARDFAGEAVELIHHGVEGFFELQDFAADIDGDLAGKVAVGDGGGDFGDVADLAGEVAGHEVDVVGEVLPGAGHAGDVGLAAELAFGADFAGHAGDFAGEGVELVHHGVDGVFEFEDFALHVDGDLAGEVAAGDGGGDFGDVADLGGEVAGHGVDGVGEVLPGSGHAGHDGLAAELAVGADFAGHARHFRSEGAQLVDHGVDGFLELQDFAAHVDGDLAGKVAAGHGGGDFGDVADLAGEVGGHGVDGVGEVLPGAGHAGHLRLAAQLAVGAHFAGHAGHLGGEDAELLDHGVDDVGGAEELAFEGTAVDVEADGLGEVALGDGGDGARDFGGGAEQVFDQGIDRDFHLVPGASVAVDADALAGPALFADGLADALQFASHLLVRGDNLVEVVGDLAGQAGP